MTEMEAFRERLDAWRSKPEAEQLAIIRAGRPIGERLAAVAACPDRGPVLPVSQQPQDCAKCGELSGCRAGRGSTPGRVTLRDCIDCVDADSVRTRD